MNISLSKKKTEGAISRILWFLRTGNHLSIGDQYPRFEHREQRFTSYLVLLREGFTLTLRFTHATGGLLPHLFTLTFRKRRFVSVALSILCICYIASHVNGTPRSVESGLSSLYSRATARTLGSIIYNYI